MTLTRVRYLVFLVMLGAGILMHVKASAWECYRCDANDECAQTASEEWGREKCVGPPEWTACSLSGARCVFIEGN
jgi:hypothetical protein